LEKRLQARMPTGKKERTEKKETTNLSLLKMARNKGGFMPREKIKPRKREGEKTALTSPGEIRLKQYPTKGKPDVKSDSAGGWSGLLSTCGFQKSVWEGENHSGKDEMGTKRDEGLTVTGKSWKRRRVLVPGRGQETKRDSSPYIG